MKHKQERRDHYAELTDRIVAELEKGVIPWQKPWNPDSCNGPQGPVNGVTGRPYHGVNVLALGMDARAFMTGDPRWCTYQQAQEHGYQVRKGEKATTIFFAKPLKVEDKERDRDDADGPATKLIHLLRAYAVFHIGTQIDGAPPYKAPTVEEAPWTRPDAIRKIMDNSGFVFRSGGERAFYSPQPKPGFIQLPPDSAFHDMPAWAATMAHEMIHRTGAEDMLARDLSGSFGSAKYAEEELVAELGSFFTCNVLNLPTNCTNNAAYLGHWAAKLKTDSRAIFRAAAQAQRASDAILGFHPDYALANKPDAEPETLKNVLPTPPAVVREAMPA